MTITIQPETAMHTVTVGFQVPQLSGKRSITLTTIKPYLKDQEGSLPPCDHAAKWHATLPTQSLTFLFSLVSVKGRDAFTQLYEDNVDVVRAEILRLSRDSKQKHTVGYVMSEESKYISCN